MWACHSCCSNHTVTTHHTLATHDLDIAGEVKAAGGARGARASEAVAARSKGISCNQSEVSIQWTNRRSVFTSSCSLLRLGRLASSCRLREMLRSISRLLSLLPRLFCLLLGRLELESEANMSSSSAASASTDTGSPSTATSLEKDRRSAESAELRPSVSAELRPAASSPWMSTLYLAEIYLIRH